MFEKIFLAVVQGITEFAPISSSGHLVIFPYLFKLTDPGLAFDTMLHFGTMLAVLIYFRQDWLRLAGVVVKFRQSQEKDRRLLALLAIATIPAVILGILLEDFAQSVFRSPLLVALMLALAGGGLWLADRWGKQQIKGDDLTLKDAGIIGIAQALALIPGVSRSGITITAGLALGLTRREAARFSFLMSGPIILGAGIYQLFKVDIASFGAIDYSAILISFGVAYGVIKYLLEYLAKKDYSIFVWYRLLLAVVVLWAIV